MSKAGKIAAIIAAVLVALLILAGVIYFTRSSTQRSIKDFQSEYTGGLNRIVRVYSHDGDKIAEYEGKIDIAERSDTVVKFQLKGKRYIYYNAVVEVIEK